MLSALLPFVGVAGIGLWLVSYGQPAPALCVLIPHLIPIISLTFLFAVWLAL
jgi:hypothetical protein